MLIVSKTKRLILALSILIITTLVGLGIYWLTLPIEFVTLQEKPTVEHILFTPPLGNNFN